MLKNEFLTVDELWRHTIKHVLDHGDELDSRAGKCLEVLGYAATLTNVESTFLMNARRNLSPYYACAELLWYLNSSASITMISAYAPQYVNFAEGGNAYGAYGCRIFSNLWGRDGQVHGDTCDKSQLELIIWHLSEDRNTRQAIITLWEANDLTHAIHKDHKDLPCTLALQLFIRNERLHMIATMRSNDAWLGLPYDIFAFTGIQHLIGLALGVKCGTYTHQVGSEHLYEKNWKAAEEATSTMFALTPDQTRMQHGWAHDKCETWREAIAIAHAVERLARIGEIGQMSREYEHLSNLLRNQQNVLCDVTSCCANKWDVLLRPMSPILLNCLNRRTESCSS